MSLRNSFSSDSSSSLLESSDDKRGSKENETTNEPLVDMYVSVDGTNSAL